MTDQIADAPLADAPLANAEPTAEAATTATVTVPPVATATLRFTVELTIANRTDDLPLDAATQQMKALFVEYLTNREGTFLNDYGVTAEELLEARRTFDWNELTWGGYDGPYVLEASVTPCADETAAREHVLGPITEEFFAEVLSAARAQLGARGIVRTRRDFDDNSFASYATDAQSEDEVRLTDTDRDRAWAYYVSRYADAYEERVNSQHEIDMFDGYVESAVLNTLRRPVAGTAGTAAASTADASVGGGSSECSTAHQGGLPGTAAPRGPRDAAAPGLDLLADARAHLAKTSRELHAAQAWYQRALAENAAAAGTAATAVAAPTDESI